MNFTEACVRFSDLISHFGTLCGIVSASHFGNHSPISVLILDTISVLILGHHFGPGFWTPFRSSFWTPFWARFLDTILGQIFGHHFGPHFGDHFGPHFGHHLHFTFRNPATGYFDLTLVSGLNRDYIFSERAIFAWHFFGPAFALLWLWLDY